MLMSTEREKPMTQFREVSKDEFHAAIGGQNVHPQIVGKWPYTSLFKTPYGEVWGKIVGYLPEGSALSKNRYYLQAK